MTDAELKGAAGWKAGGRRGSRTHLKNSERLGGWEGGRGVRLEKQVRAGRAMEAPQELGPPRATRSHCTGSGLSRRAFYKTLTSERHGFGGGKGELS